MKQYKVRFYNYARHVAVQRLVDETGAGLNENEIMEVTKEEG